MLIQPGKQTVIYIKSPVYTRNEVTGIIQPSLDLEDNDDSTTCPSLTTAHGMQYTVLINNFLEPPYTLFYHILLPYISILCFWMQPAGLNFFGKTPLFFR